MKELVESADPFEQFVLLSVVELTMADETPAHSYDVSRTAKAHLDEIEREPFGGVERQEVIATLGTLAEDGLLTKARTKSPTGKGRSVYELAVEPDNILATLSRTDLFDPYIESIRTESAE
ncbi:hypothetical protein Harman_00100 [Haloarcula mannanilytica]|uniref:Uncharacterized protein n=1 Tax=Haloarcula mannanilytica TaxID=2509225 RepID=A0A4C2EC32_9EURY|nr:hypothetical protein [Haloarcula mannanilytica]GCF12075.1 hypothetical protein Harman_00100 [Haloarcula mannanilytica]